MDHLHFVISYILLEVMHFGADVLRTMGGLLLFHHLNRGGVVLMNCALDGCARRLKFNVI